jgi:MtfA peptidase
LQQLLKKLIQWFDPQARLQATLARRHIHESLWQTTLEALPFVKRLPAHDVARLRVLASLFLDQKEFSGAQGFVVSDAHAVMVAVQACVPVLHIAPLDQPEEALAWYDGFVGIVLHAGQVRAQRQWVDDDGIEHSGHEDLTGETLEGGPLMLAWSDVAAAGEMAQEAYNVVIHEFIHVMDLRDGQADGCPPMPVSQRKQWLASLQREYQAFCEQTEQWQRFGRLTAAAQPLLDPYGASSIDEFFAVAAEAYFVQSTRFTNDYPSLHAMFEDFFKGQSARALV